MTDDTNLKIETEMTSSTDGKKDKWTIKEVVLMALVSLIPGGLIPVTVYFGVKKWKNRTKHEQGQPEGNGSSE